MKNRILVNTTGVLMFLCFTLYGCHAFSQTNLFISGIVLDKETGNPLAYSTVGIKGRAKGVVTNKIGEFDFTFSNTLLNDSLIISMMGYTSEIHAIKNLINRETLIFELKPKPILLDEVVINHPMLKPDQIVKKAIANIGSNYPEEAYMMEAFYRDYKTENGKCVGLIESAISIYDKGYTKPNNKSRLQELVALREIRKIVTVDYKADLYKNWNFLNLLLRANDVRYVSQALEREIKTYEFERFSAMDDKLVYVIKTSGPWTSYLYIDTESFAVLKIELDAKWDETRPNEWIMNDSIINRTSYVRKNLKFKKYNGVYYPIYSNYSWRIEAFSINTGESLFTTDFFQEILVNNIHTQGVQKPDKKDLMHEDHALELQSKPYNKAFWKHYNIIKQNPLEQKLIRDLEQKISMEKQFEQSN